MEATRPETIEELERERADVLEEMAQIRNQLAMRKADIDAAALASGSVDRYGKPIVDTHSWLEFTTWRAKATSALRFKELELMDIKAAIRERRSTLGAVGASGLGDDPLRQLAALHKTARGLVSRVGGFKSLDPSDQAVIDHVGNFLSGRA